MNLPANIVVGPYVFTVRGKRFDEPNQLGETSKPKSRITIDPRQCELSKRDTLIHETLHAIFHVASLNDPLKLDDDAEELIISALSPWLLMVLRDNPELVECLTSTVE